MSDLETRRLDEANRRIAELERERRDCMLAFAAAVMAVGGELRIPEQCIVDADEGTLRRWEDLDTRDIVFRVDLPQPRTTPT